MFLFSCLGCVRSVEVCPHTGLPCSLAWDLPSHVPEELWSGQLRVSIAHGLRSASSVWKSLLKCESFFCEQAGTSSNFPVRCGLEKREVRQDRFGVEFSMELLRMRLLRVRLFILRLSEDAKEILEKNWREQGAAQGQVGAQVA